MTFVPIRNFVLGALAIAGTLPGQVAGAAALEPLRFLTGQWVSETPSDTQEETWSSARGGSMIGSFRVVQHGQPVFYEFWAVELEAGRPVLKLKHFNADLVGWEDKNSSTRLELRSNAQNDVLFAESNGGVSLHYHRTGETLTCIVHHVQNGKASDETFVLHRVRDQR